MIFYVVEGINGSGKTTLLNDKVKLFNDRYFNLNDIIGKEVVFIAPKPKEFSEKDLKLFTDPTIKKSEDEWFEFALLFLNNQQKLSDMMRQDENKDKIFISDRWTLSTYVYTLSEFLNKEDMKQKEMWMDIYNKLEAYTKSKQFDILKPDYLNLLAVYPDECYARILKRKDKPLVSRYENLEKLEILSFLYNKLINFKDSYGNCLWAENVISPFYIK